MLEYLFFFRNCNVVIFTYRRIESALCRLWRCGRFFSRRASILEFLSRQISTNSRFSVSPFVNRKATVVAISKRRKKNKKRSEEARERKYIRHVSCRYKITEQVALRGWFSRSICAYRLASLLLSAHLPRPLQLYCLSLYLLYIFLSFNRSHFFLATG